jgi:hypothetical protein
MMSSASVTHRSEPSPRAGGGPARFRPGVGSEVCQWPDVKTIRPSRPQGTLLSPTLRSAAPRATRVGWAPPRKRPPAGSCSGARDLAERPLASVAASRSSARAPAERAPSKYDIAPPRTGATGSLWGLPQRRQMEPPVPHRLCRLPPRSVRALWRLPPQSRVLSSHYGLRDGPYRWNRVRPAAAAPVDHFQRARRCRTHELPLLRLNACHYRLRAIWPKRSSHPSLTWPCRPAAPQRVARPRTASDTWAFLSVCCLSNAIIGGAR